MKGFLLYDYIEGIRAEDVTVKVKLRFNQKHDPDHLPYLPPWSLSEMKDLQTSLILK